MGLIKEPLDVDFYLIDKPWNSADTKEFSALIKKLKSRTKVKNINKVKRTKVKRKAA